MKITILLLVFIIIGGSSVQGQEFPAMYDEKVLSIDSIVPAIFEIVSGEKGEERNWALMRKVFHPEARLILNHPNKEGKAGIYFFTVEDYIDQYAAAFRQMDLYEQEVQRVTEKFGNMAQVFSTYESFENENETNPHKRGMAGIQLYHDGERWWVLTMYWKNETQGISIPDKYLSSSKN